MSTWDDLLEKIGLNRKDVSMRGLERKAKEIMRDLQQQMPFLPLDDLRLLLKRVEEEIKSRIGQLR